MDLDGLDRLLDLAKDRLPPISGQRLDLTDSHSGAVVQVDEFGRVYCAKCLMVLPGTFVEAALDYEAHTCEWKCGLCGAAFSTRAFWTEHISWCAVHGPKKL